MNQRPRITLEPGDGDKMLESLGRLALILLWCLAGYYYSRLPAIVPTHFNGAGRIDNYGPKGTIFILPLVGTVMFVSMTLLNRFPHVFNYPVAITDQNARAQYTLATRLLRFLKAAIALAFAVLEWFIAQAAMGKAAGLGVWVLPVFVTTLLVPTAFYIYQSYREK